MSSRKIIWLLVLLGSIVRVVFGMKFEYWNLAPDQLAIELTLNDLINAGSWSYSKLIHYPHEGGTIVIILLSLLFKPLFSFSSLVVSAFVLDTLVRYVQISVIDQLFGKKAAIYFAAWTVVGIPLLIPLSFFGLHWVSSIFPFLFLFLVNRSHSTWKEYAVDGLFLGVSIWFNYSNIVLVPVYAFYLLWRGTTIKFSSVAFAILSLVIILHALVRLNFDAGFVLSDFALTSIRGESFDLLDITVYGQILTIYTQHLPQVSLLESIGPLSELWVRRIWYWICLVGIGSFVLNFSKHKLQLVVFSCMILVMYFAIYALSPFYLEWPEYAHFVNARHFTYAMPLFVGISLVGLSEIRLNKLAYSNYYNYLGFILFLTPCVFSAFSTYSKEPSNVILERPTGWVLASKFGHLPSELVKINSNHIYDQKEIATGIGWGTATNIFVMLNDSTSDTLILNQKVSQIVHLLDQYEEYREEVLSGVEYAFSADVTPKLDSNILINRILPALKSNE